MSDHRYEPPVYDPDADRSKSPRRTWGDEMTEKLVDGGERTKDEAERTSQTARRGTHLMLLPRIADIPHIPLRSVVHVAIQHRRRDHRPPRPPQLGEKRAARRAAGRSQAGRSAHTHLGQITPHDLDMLLTFAATLAPQPITPDAPPSTQRIAAHQRRMDALSERIRTEAISKRDRSWISLLRAAESGDAEAVQRLAQIRAGERTPLSEPQAVARTANRSPETLRMEIADQGEQAWIRYWDGAVGVEEHEEQAAIAVQPRIPGIPCKRGRILDHGGCVIPDDVDADQLGAILLASSQGIDARKTLGHIILTWHDDVRHLVTDDVRCWAARAALAGRGLDPEQTTWALLDHSDDGRMHIPYARVTDGRIHDSTYRVPISAAVDAIIDRISTARARPATDSPPCDDARAYASLASIADGITDARVAAWRSPGGHLEKIDMIPAAIAERIARLVGPPPPGLGRFGAALSLDKPSIPRSATHRFMLYLLG